MCSCARLVVGDVVVDPNTGAVTAVGMGIVPVIFLWWGVQCDWVREHGAIYIGNEVVAVATVGEATIWDTRRNESLIVKSGVVNNRLEERVMADNGPGTQLGVGYSNGSVGY